MAINSVKYVSLNGLEEFYAKLQGELAKDYDASNRVLPVKYAEKATKDASGNTITTTYETKDHADATYVKLSDTSYIKTINFQASGAQTASPLTVTNNAVTLDLHEYALKSEITAALHFKGVKATESALPSTDVAVGDVWIVTTDDAGDANSEFVCTAISPSITWEKLGPTKDFSGFVQKLTVGSGAGEATAGDILVVASDGSIEDSGVAGSKLSGGSVADDNTSFVTGGQVYDAIDEAIGALDMAQAAGGSGYMITTVNETDGVVSATAVALDTAIPSSNPSTTVAPTTSAVKTYVDGQISGLDYSKVVQSDGSTKIATLAEATNAEIDSLFVAAS